MSVITVADRTLKAKTLEYKLNSLIGRSEWNCAMRVATMPLLKVWAKWLTPKAKRWTNFCFVDHINNTPLIKIRAKNRCFHCRVSFQWLIKEVWLFPHKLNFGASECAKCLWQSNSKLIYIFFSDLSNLPCCNFGASKYAKCLSSL